MTPKTDDLQSSYQATSDSVAKKLEGLYNSLDAKEKRVFESILTQSRGKAVQPLEDKTTVLVNTPMTVRTENVIKLMSQVLCW